MIMSGKHKLYFLLNRISDARDITPSDQSLIIDPTNDLNRNYRDVELKALFEKLEKDEKVLQIIKPAKREKSVLDEFDPYDHVDDGCYHVKLLPSFEDYFSKIQEEPEYQEYTGKTPAKQASKPLGLDLANLHPEIYKKCQSLFGNAEYPEAVEKGFKIVKDRLRRITGYEKGSEAFGKSKLHIKGAAASNVDADFNEGVKFLAMAIDMFRNEKSHTSDSKIDDQHRAYEYLTLSSLALNLLDQAEILA